MTTQFTRTLARILEIANYLLLIPATFAAFVFTRGLFIHGVDIIWRHPEFVVYAVLPAIFYVLGLVFHLLYFQISRGRQLFIPLPIRWVWGLSALFNLLLTGYFVFFGSFAALVAVWTLCVTVLSLVAFINAYRTSSMNLDYASGKRATADGSID